MARMVKAHHGDARNDIADDRQMRRFLNLAIGRIILTGDDEYPQPASQEPMQSAEIVGGISR
jgi:hypothetical protein